MRVLLQRVTRAGVSVVEPDSPVGHPADGPPPERIVGQIGHGLTLLVGVAPDDDADIVARMADKIARLRIFSDAEGRFNLSLLDVRGEALVISQFTLFADARKGRRPSFVGAAAPEHAAPLCDRFAECLRLAGVARVETGRFGAAMRVELVNDGPVTLWLDSEALGLGPAD